MPIAQMVPYLDAIENDEPLGLDLPLSRQILSALADHPDRMTVKTVDRFLHADEAVVRAEAVRTWLRLPRIDDDAMLDRIGTDRAPSVALAVLKSAVDAWPEIGEDLLDDWLGRIDQKLDGILEDVRDSKQWLASSRFIETAKLNAVDPLACRPGLASLSIASET